MTSSIIRSFNTENLSDAIGTVTHILCGGCNLENTARHGPLLNFRRAS